MGFRPNLKLNRAMFLTCVLHLHSLGSRRLDELVALAKVSVRTTSFFLGSRLCRRLVLFILLEVLRRELSIDEHIKILRIIRLIEFWFINRFKVLNFIAFIA